MNAPRTSSADATAPARVAEQALAALAPLQGVIVVEASHEVNTRWARNTVTTNGDLRSSRITVIAMEQRGDTAAYASLTRPLAGCDVKSLAAETAASARSAPVAPDAMPLPTAAGGSSGGFAEGPRDVETAALDTPFADLGEVFGRASAERIEHFGYLELGHSTTWLLTSSGVALRHEQPAVRLEMTAKSHNRTRSTWAGYSGASLQQVDITGLDSELRRGLGWQARSTTIDPGRRTVVLSPSATADLMVDLYWGADARSAHEGRSAFSVTDGSPIGRRVSSRDVRLVSDPAMPGRECAAHLITTVSHDAASVFDNGLPLRPTEWIAGGEVRNLVGSRHAAGLAGLPANPWIDNLSLDATGSGSLDDLIARTGDGVLVTCTWYNRMVDPHTHMITGLTRDGTYLINGGEVVGVLPNFRFNDSPLGLLDRIADASQPVATLGREMADYFPRTVAPALQVADFNLSSVSEAV